MLQKIKNNICISLLVFGCTANTPHYIGEQYLGARYLVDSLGEDEYPDNDPLIRFDAFDCTTFVETSLAGGDLNNLTKIRYKDGKIDFINRNHFTETDWISNNGFENVSKQYGKTAIRNVLIDKKSWFNYVHNIDTDFAIQQTSIEYIPYKNLSKIDIQSPLIVLFIHDGDGFKNKIGTDLAVVHMGFLLPGNILRHASSEHGYVMDVDFNDYVKMREQNKHNIGITLVKIK